MSDNKDPIALREVYCKIADIKCQMLSIVIKEENQDDQMMRIIIKKLEKIQNEIKQYMNLNRTTLNTSGPSLTNATTKELIKAAITKAAGTEKK